MPIATTHTYVILDVTAACFREIQGKLEASGYLHVFHKDADGQLVMDLSGIALRDEEGDEGPTPFLVLPRRA